MKFIILASLLSITNAVVFNKCKQPGQLALSFDEGPSIENTAALLDIFKDKKVLVNFHFITQFATDAKVQELMKRAANEGHLIGLRSEPFWNLEKATAKEVKALFASTSFTLATITKQNVKFVRLAYNKYNPKVVLPVLQEMDFIVTEHNLDSNDYKNDKEIEQSFQVALEKADLQSDSFITLSRDSVGANVQLIGKIIDFIHSKGFKIVRLDDCLEMKREEKNQKVEEEKKQDGEEEKKQVEEEKKQQSENVENIQEGEKKELVSPPPEEEKSSSTVLAPIIFLSAIALLAL